LTKKPTVMEVAQIPDDVRELWGKPALLHSEDPTAYDKVARTVVQAVGPSNGIEWLLTNDVIAHSWEIRRLRQFKTLLIELRREEHLFRQEEEDVEEERKFQESERGETDMFLNNLEPWEKIDHLLTIAEARRIGVLREIDRRRTNIADRLREASNDIIEGEFEEHNPRSKMGTPSEEENAEAASEQRPSGLPRVILKRRSARRG
jgi:hypothetical protein